MRLCSVEGCGRKHSARGYCHRCYQRTRYQTDSEYRARARNSSRSQYKDHQNRERASALRRYRQNRDERHAQHRRWTKKNLDKIRVRNREYYHQRREEVIALLGGPVCKSCGASEQPTKDGRAFLQIDHVNGNGREQRQERSPLGILGYALSHPEEFQVLCGPCNQKKRRAEQELVATRAILEAYRAHHAKFHPDCNISGPEVPPKPQEGMFA